ncbi:uncharacterized protein LOC126681731 isoform X4 [Mercurialis annua]|uniref:uncharacterized protein LOC126681731 isoform X4 n=1 Tax=Mercurialis annua TaxID=3986 RepID=UPI0024AECBB9|nr:uncharacterized protein LOC126681731 isoform X4 [Mercurialis annua]
MCSHTAHLHGGNSQDFAPPVEGVAGGGTAYGWTDGGLYSSNLPKGLSDLSEVQTAELVHVWCMPSTANVGAQELPRHLEPVNLLAARNERESVQIALRPKVSWSSSGGAGTVQVQCTDLSSTSGDRLVAGQSILLRKVVPILGVPDALVPLDHPISQISLVPGETSAIWVSIDVPSAQPPGQYEGEFIITAIKAGAESQSQCFNKAEKHGLYMELRNCLDIVEPIEGRALDEVVERVKSASTSLRRVLLSPSFSEFFSDNGPVDMMDEDAVSNLSVRIKISLTVWDFRVPITPSFPTVFGISDTVIEDRFGVEHGTTEWYDALEQHFKWLLQYRISPYFCRWGDSMRVFAYTCPWPADHPKSDEYLSDPRLAAYAVPYSRAVSCNDAEKDYLQKEIEMLRTKSHWKKAYLYLWDEPLNLDHYNSVRNMAGEIHAYAPDARILTTYYCVSGCLVIETIWLKTLSPSCSQRMVRNGGHMCALDPLILIQIGIWGCEVPSTELSCGVHGKKVELDFYTGVRTAMRRLYFLAQRYDLGAVYPLVMVFYSILVKCSRLHVNQLLHLDWSAFSVACRTSST